MPPRKKSRISNLDTRKKDEVEGAAHVSKQKGLGSSRRSELLVDLPVELQLEILRRLHPRDLFNLARTCKKLRVLTLQRSSERLWKAAWIRAGDLPNCPYFLSEPAFIHLLMSTHCQECGHHGVRRPIMMWFKRYCVKCTTNLSYCYQDVSDKLHELDKRILGERDCHEENMLSMFNVHRLSQGSGQSLISARRRSHWRFQRSDIDWFVQAYRELERPVSDGYCAELVDWQKEENEVRHHHAEWCIEWEEEQAKSKEAEMEKKRKQFFPAKGELDEMSRLPIVLHAAKLKKPVWGKILEAMLDFMEQKRKQREGDEREKLLEARFEELDNAILAQYVRLPRKVHMEFCPQVIDLALMQEIKCIVNSPSSETVTYDSFKQVMPSVAAQWQRHCKEELEDWLLSTLGNYTMTIEPLNLAIAVFVCEGECLAWQKDKVRIMHYPEVLGHKCLRKPPPGAWHELPDDVYGRTATHCGSNPEEVDPETFVPFNLGHFAPEDVDVNVEKMAKIVDALGLTSARATVQELKACDRRLRCKKCVAAPDLDYVYTWEAARNHSIRSHPKRGGSEGLGFLLDEDEGSVDDSDSEDAWELVKEEDMNTVRLLEATAHAPKMGVCSVPDLL
ncbi:hypothetical protein C8T65DRAFT_827821 [Cerioporus squamosus]|nr:hypothetical protein C8T65DRAFT_827821 [Cerioporus squamosus]